MPESKHDTETFREQSQEWDVNLLRESKTFDMDKWSYWRHKDFELHLLQKLDGENEQQRPRIPATEAERLSYYRTYITAPAKTQMVYLQQFAYSSFLWLQVTDVLLKHFPMNYLHVFLASYSPDEHLFAGKMVPLLLGIRLQIILSSLFQLVHYADILGILAVYAVEGFFMQSPWDRCKSDVFPNPTNTHLIHCYSIDNFMNVAHEIDRNDTEVEFRAHAFYLVNSSQYFTAAPLSYLIMHIDKVCWWNKKSIKMFFSFLTIWLISAFCYKALYTKSVWKCHKYCSLVTNVVYMITIVYILYAYAESKVKPIKRVYSLEKHVNLGLGWDFDLHAESFTSPPVVQVLSSRSTQPGKIVILFPFRDECTHEKEQLLLWDRLCISKKEINPGRDSTLITVSNYLMHWYRGLLIYLIKTYVESEAKLPVMVAKTNPYTIFYLWPFFFHKITLGMFTLRVFYFINFCLEMCTFIITYQILLEVIVWEYRWLHRFWASVLVTLVGITLNLSLLYQVKNSLYIAGVVLSGLSEIVAVCWFYPNRRLFDDVHFHQGLPMMSIRKWGMRILPFFYIYKMYSLYMTYEAWAHDEELQKEVRMNMDSSDRSSYRWAWLVVFIPLPVGTLIAIVYYVSFMGKSWTQLIKPLPSWGPREYHLRQLRKRFDSREYVESQTSRYLSRHMLSKAHTACYKLELCYDDVPRSSIRRSSVASTKRESKSFDKNFVLKLA